MKYLLFVGHRFFGLKLQTFGSLGYNSLVTGFLVETFI